MQDTNDYMSKKNISSLVISVKNIANPLNLINNFPIHLDAQSLPLNSSNVNNFRAYGLFGYSRNAQEHVKLRLMRGGNTCFHMGGNFQGCSHAVNCYFKVPPPPGFYIPPVVGPSTCKQTNRGTQRQFPPKYIENTF